MINDLIDDGEIQGIVEDTMQKVSDTRFRCRMVESGVNFTNAALWQLAEADLEIYITGTTVEFVYTGDREQDT